MSATIQTKGASDIAAQVITDKLLEMMGDGSEASLALWRKGLAQFTASGLPYNAETGKAYSGGNVITLMIQRQRFGHESNGWITLGNISKRGYTIIKGCKNPWAWVLSPMIIMEKKDANGMPVMGKDGKAIKFNTGRQRAYKVFNMSCVNTNGKPVPGRKAMEKLADPTFNAMDALLAHHKPKLTHGGNEAFYRPIADTVTMPLKAAFPNEQCYTHVLAHEMSHWTGNKDRLNRDQTGRFGGEDYAFEELIAELSAAFTMARMGMGDSQMAHHANYLKSWIKALKDDSTFIMKAATKASAASNYLMDPLEDNATDADDVPGAE